MSEMTYIAIVDDHTMFRKGLCALIDVFPGYKVLFDAGNGKEFIEKIKPPHVPDIVLLDISMPFMDGYATADWITTNLPDTHILALSTIANDNAIIKMIKHGAKGYILKDAEPSELKLAFREVITKGYFYNELVSSKILRSITALVDENSATTTFTKLNQRELDFLKRVCSEKSYKEIAGEMFLSERTIDGYRETLFKKLGVSTRVGLVLFAIKNKLVEL